MSGALLQFLKDVLYGLHGFAIADPSSYSKKRTRKHFFTCCTNHLSEGTKSVLEPIKMTPKTVLWRLCKQPDETSKTGHQKKSLFAPGTPRGVCCFRFLDPGNGTLVIYIDMYICLYLNRYIYIYIYIYVFVNEF